MLTATYGSFAVPKILANRNWNNVYYVTITFHSFLVSRGSHYLMISCRWIESIPRGQLLWEASVSTRCHLLALICLISPGHQVILIYSPQAVIVAQVVLLVEETRLYNLPCWYLFQADKRWAEGEKVVRHFQS